MRNRCAVGIDVGTFQVKVVVAQDTTSGGAPQTAIIGTGSAESKGLRHGYIVGGNDARRSIESAIRQAERAANIRIKSAYLSIGGIGLEEFRTKVETLISRADGEVTSFDVEKIGEQSEQSLGKKILNRKVIHAIPIGYTLEGAPILGQPVGMRGTRLGVETLFVTALEQHLQDLIGLVEDMGIAVNDVMAAPLAGSFVTLTKAQKTAGCVLANIGAETVSIVVYENNTPLSVKVFPIGSTAITNDIALGLKISLEDAEALKRGTLLGTAYSQKKLDAIIQARLTDMFDLVEAHLASIGKSGMLPAGVIISGGGSGLATIEDLARNILKLPSKRAAFTANEQAKLRDSSWAVAYGLCLWGMSNERETGFGSYLRELKEKATSFVARFLP